MEFPILAKYRPKSLSGARPYVLAGFRLSPEFRYTRWGGSFGTSDSIRLFQTTTRDQFQVLFGVSFGSRN